MAEPAAPEDLDAYAEENGVPRFEEPFIQRYLDGRDALIAQEKNQRSDHTYRQTLSPMAGEAAAIIAAIRFEEQQNLWQPQVDDELATDVDAPVFPGMMFTLAKTRMESSKLYKIVRKMPKGALLHCHLDATGDMEWLYETALATPGMCMSSTQSLHTVDRRKVGAVSFRFLKPESASKGSAIWSPEYTPGDMIPLAEAARSFPDGGQDGFHAWFMTRVMITPEEAISHHMGPNDIWTKFVSCFGVVKGLHRYEPIFRGLVRNILSSLHEDGVKWVDIRTDFTQPYFKEGSETASPDYGDMLEALEEEIANFQASAGGQGFWGARLIWTAIRHGDTRAIVEDMKECIAMKQDFPDLIGGYDLVGQEDLGRPLADLLPELFWFKKACAEVGINIPFFFHAGETLGDGDSVDENIFDAVLLGTRRIGHGLSLYKHPLLCDMVKEKKILIESCPISNEILRFTGSIMSHTLPALLARGIACSLSNDDPAMLGQGSSGVSADFWQTLQGWESLGLPGLASLAENSVRWANYEDCTPREWTQSIKDGAYGHGIRAERMQEWAAEFEKFCAWVVQEYGAETDIKTLD